MRAALLLGAAESQWRRSGARHFPIEESSHNDDVRAVRAACGHDRFARAWEEGRSMDMARVFAYALDEPA